MCTSEHKVVYVYLTTYFLQTPFQVNYLLLAVRSLGKLVARFIRNFAALGGYLHLLNSTRVTQ